MTTKPTTTRWYNPAPEIARLVMAELGHGDAVSECGLWTVIEGEDADHLRGQVVALWKAARLMATSRTMTAVALDSQSQRHADRALLTVPQARRLAVVGGGADEPRSWDRYADVRGQYVRAVLMAEEAKRLVVLLPTVVPGFQSAARRLLGVGAFA